MEFTEPTDSVMEESKDLTAPYKQKIAATAINQRHRRAAEKQLAQQVKEW